MIAKKYDFSAKGTLSKVNGNGDIEIIDKDSVDIVNVIEELKQLEGCEIRISFSRTEKIVTVPDV